VPYIAHVTLGSLGFSRRSLLAGAGATLAAPHIACAQPAGDADVLIVGAGAAGLAAARECQRLGKSFVVLEARDRIGGRVFTDTILGQPFDAGARYIHWAERNPWAEVARDLRVPTSPDVASPGGFRFFANGKPVPEADRSLRRQAFAALSRLLDDDPANVPDVSLAQEVAARGDLAEAAGALARMALGEEPQRVSARDYARLWSGADLLVPGGYGMLVQAYGAGLPVRLSTPVKTIRWDGLGVAAETHDGAIRARAAIVTVPAPVLASGAIRFLPELPAATRDALAGLGAGALTKVALKFEGGARFDVPPDSDIFEAEGSGETFDFECWTFGRDLVIANFGGDHARRITAGGETGTIAATLGAFVRVVGGSARKSFVGGSVHAWHRDPYSLGCYSHCLPGHADARMKLAEPIADRIFFAGEATGGEDFGGAMTAGGAFLAGRAAARKAAGL
jgi:monoamine oxidase